MGKKKEIFTTKEKSKLLRLSAALRSNLLRRKVKTNPSRV